MQTAKITLPFIAEEEGIAGAYRGSDIAFSITLNADTGGVLSIEGLTTPLTCNWQNAGVKDGEAGTETSLKGGDGAARVDVTVEQLELGYARASLYWPNATPVREILGFCDDWKSLT